MLYVYVVISYMLLAFIFSYVSMQSAKKIFEGLLAEDTKNAALAHIQVRNFSNSSLLCYYSLHRTANVSISS